MKPKRKPAIKFKRTLCDTRYHIHKGIVIVLDRSSGGRWTASCRVRDNFRFVKDERLEAFEVTSKTQQEAAVLVITGLRCMASIDEKFAAYLGTIESEEEFFQESLSAGGGGGA